MRLPAFICLVGLLSSEPPPAQNGAQKIKPVLIWTGTDSKYEKAECIRCRTVNEWTNVWLKHHGDGKDTAVPNCPIINFEAYEVVVIFHGQSIMNTGLDIVEVEQQTHTVYLRYRPSWYSIFVSDGGRENMIPHSTRSFAFIVLPIKTQDIVVQEDNSGGRNTLPEWQERARLPAKKQPQP